MTRPLDWLQFASGSMPNRDAALGADGDWYKDFGSFKICGGGSYPKTFLLREQVAKGEAL